MTLAKPALVWSQKWAHVEFTLVVLPSDQGVGAMRAASLHFGADSLIVEDVPELKLRPGSAVVRLSDSMVSPFTVWLGISKIRAFAIDAWEDELALSLDAQPATTAQVRRQVKYLERRPLRQRETQPLHSRR